MQKDLKYTQTKSNLYLLDQKTKEVLNPLGNFLSSSIQPVCELQWLKNPRNVIPYRKLFRQNSKNRNTIMSSSLPFCTKNLADGPWGVFESLQSTGGGEERNKNVNNSQKTCCISTLHPKQLFLHWSIFCPFYNHTEFL